MAATTSDELLREFFSQGFVRCPQVVDRDFCNVALRDINQQLGEPLPPGVQREKIPWTSTSITRLFNNSPSLRAEIGRLLGDESLVPFLFGAQVALRFPGTLCFPGSFSPVPWWPSAFHIDGLPSTENEVAEGCIRNFTLLIGVCLQDVLTDMSGNFVVYPRSHHVMEQYFRTEGFDVAKQGLVSLPGLPLADPVQLHLRKGDAVLAHYSLCHTIAPNCGPDIRYMVYFRVNLRGDGFHPLPMTDIWTDYSPAFRRFSETQDATPCASTAIRSAGYIDALTRSQLAEALHRDKERNATRIIADRMFEEHRWSECREMMVSAAAAQPDDVMLCLKAGICSTASDKQYLQEGEQYLRRLTTELAPSLAKGWVALARNLQRQQMELQRDSLEEGVICARTALLNCTLDPEIVVESIMALVDLNVAAEQLASIATAAKLRYPELAEKIDQVAKVDPSKGLWLLGHKWLVTEPKDLPRGLDIFGRLVAVASTDYWAHILFGACLVWSGQPARALEILEQARSIDPLFPHSYVVAAQAAKLLGRPADAVASIERLFEQGSAIKCDEADHFQKIVEAVQIAADCLPSLDPKYQRLLEAAKTLFPSLLPQLNAIRKQDQSPGCLLT